MRKPLLLLPLLAFCLCSCIRGYEKVGGYAQGGTYTVTYNARGVSRSRERIQADIDSILNVIDTTLSGYNKASQVSRLARGEKLRPSKMLEEIFTRARVYWEDTDGALDVAAAPIYDLWGFGFTRDSMPDPDRIKAALACCGMGRLPGTIREAVDRGDTVRLNFNAIAQGFSCDEVAAYLHSIGIRDMLVDIGEIYCEGLNPSGKNWKIGIDRPVDGNQTPGADLQESFSTDSRPCGIVTSGNYRKFYVKDGKKYSHSIDPRTGYPVQHTLLSATIIARNAEIADAYATYCMVVGPKMAREFITEHGLKGYLVSSEGVWESPGFNNEENEQ